ncbi:unnamed protein product [Oncorhynchus mykiss]|uniref:DUF5604 domain-containing protein n=1 Tax=Oncorhynchus mykiss TaxID=8022 RepID=A0A060ZG82_ONCMY|nr:unnamed protein product [Oncorhynchus mykiss]
MSQPRSLHRSLCLAPVTSLSLLSPHRMEVEGWDSGLEEELGVSLEELSKWIEEEVERSEAVRQRKAQLAELKEWVEQKEKEEEVVDKLFNNANQSIVECEALVKSTYSKMGLVYKESSSEDEGGVGGVQSSDVIEIDDDDDDDDVIAVGLLVPPKKPGMPVHDAMVRTNN